MTPRKTAILCAFMGMVGFGVYHWFVIAQVVAVFVEGVVWSLVMGVAVGWCYERSMLQRGRHGTAWGAAFGAMLATTLVPYEVVGLVWGPFPPVAGAGDFLTALPLAFLGIPVAFAWAILLGRGRVEWSFVLAVFLLHFMIGGSLAQFGGRGPSAWLFAGFVCAEITLGTILGWTGKQAAAKS